jgi:hypothetical protein
LADLLPVAFPGFTTSRDDFLISTDRDELEERINRYFDPKISNIEIKAKYPSAMETKQRFDPNATRAKLLSRGRTTGEIFRSMYRPMDARWLFWESETKLLDEKRADYKKHVLPGNLWLEARQKQTVEEFSRGYVSSLFSDSFGNGRSSFFPLALNDGSGTLSQINLPKPLLSYLVKAGLNPEAIFGHATSILHTPSYRSENLGALRMDWPRIPVPGDTDLLKHSAALGEALAMLLNPETAASGISTGTLRSGLRVLGLPTKRGGKPLSAADLSLTAGWGSAQNAGGGAIVMPGRGLTVARDYTLAERTALEAEAHSLGMTLDELLALIGLRTLDIHLNADVFWSNVPEKVWGYTLSGYQVIKKWLSYREQIVLSRALKLEEATYVSEMVRRIAAILMMTPALDANYRACIAGAQTYEQLGLSRDAVRERKGAKTLKQGASQKHTPATKQNREAARARSKLKKAPAKV